MKTKNTMYWALLITLIVICPFRASGQNTPPRNEIKPEIRQQEVPKIETINPAVINQERKQPLIIKPEKPEQEKVPLPQGMRKRTQKTVVNQVNLPKPVNTQIKNLSLFPDQYSELDDLSSVDTRENEVVLKTLEHARQKYIQALILVEKGDTLNAAKYFEKAIEVLNRVVSFPGIEQNENFSDLARSIIEDYENFVQSIETLNDDSPFFVVRNKLFDEVDEFKPAQLPVLKTIDLPRDTSTAIAIIGNQPLVTEPKALIIPLDDNEEVQKNIAFLTAQGKKGGKRFFERWLERSGKWFPLMRRIAAEEEAPEELIYLSMIESGLRPTAVSSAKAVGLWQFIRSTGEMYQLNDTSSVWLDERRDPEKSTRAAMRHLKDLYNTFGDWHLALAAYNCGAGRVSRTRRNYGGDTASFWEIRDKLPKQTQHYVPIYLATTKIALNPKAYGFNPDSIKFDEEYTYDTYDLNEPVSLSVIAKCVDTTREYIQDLNPEILRSITPPDFNTYTIKLPKEKKQLFVANYLNLTPKEKEPWVMHTVRRGESVSKIARDYGISRNEIASANELPSYRTRLKSGTSIKIPIDKDFFQDKKQEEEEQIAAEASAPKIIQDKNTTLHTVKTGETLYSIANKYNLRMADLRNLNNLPYDDDNIRVGQKLAVSNSEKPANTVQTEQVASSNTKFIRHKIKTGENLHALAENYNVSVADIKKMNNLNNDKIMVGQMLVIETPSGANNYTTKTSEGKETVHKVQKGETLGSIAGVYGVSENDLKKWNPKTINGETVYLGSKLRIEEPQISKGSSQAPENNINKASKFYIVQRGDTLSSIARKFGVNLEDLKKRNKDLNADNLLVGQKLRIQ